MALITSITLASGTSISIPVFAAVESEDFVVVTRANGVLMDIQGNSLGGEIIYQALSDSDLLDLGRIITGHFEADNLNIETQGSTYLGHKIGFLAWIYDSYSDRYVTTANFNYSPSTNSIDYTLAWCNGSVLNKYYNDICRSNANYAQFPYQNFYDGVSAAKNGDIVPPQPIINVRSGGVYSIDILTNSGYQYIYTLTTSGMSVDELTLKSNLDTYIEDNPDSEAGYHESDGDFTNPYGITVSEGGGGDGDGTAADVDSIDKMEVPDLPTIDINNCGFITTYSPTLGQLQSLANFLWSSAFDIDSFKKLFTSPMECIIGLGIVPVEPEYSGAEVVKFGDVSTGVSMVKVKQYARKSCGSVKIKKYIGSFLDYAPYVKIAIYLPYIGIRELSADDVMGDTVSVDYNIDVLTGGLACIVSTADKGVLYQYNGNCITNVPLTSINYSQAIQNAVSAAGSVATMAVGAVTGAAPVAAMGAASLATQAANTAVNSKPSIQRSGAMGGSAGMLSVQTPYLIINRPKLSVPDKLNRFTGNTYNVTRVLGSLKGFTMVDYIHLSNVPCTDPEREELMTLLKQGVIF